MGVFCSKRCGSWWRRVDELPRKNQKGKKEIIKIPKIAWFFAGETEIGDLSEQSVHKDCGAAVRTHRIRVNFENSMLKRMIYFIFLFFRCHFRIVLRRGMGGEEKAGDWCGWLKVWGGCNLAIKIARQA